MTEQIFSNNPESLFLESQEENHKVMSFCIAHVKPSIPHETSTIYLEIGPNDTLDRTKYQHVYNCFENIEYGKRYRKELGSTLGSFAAAKYLRNLECELDFAINISTYRTFMLADRKLSEFHKVLKLNFVTSNEAQKLGELALPKLLTSKWRLPMPIYVGSIESNYAHCHHLDDLDLYLDIANSEQVLSTKECAEMRRSKVLLPGALSVGIMPADLFCDFNYKLERVTRLFLEQFNGVEHDNYQIRAANFCHERLGSYLIQRYLQKIYGGLPKSHFGYWTRVSDELEYTQGKM